MNFSTTDGGSPNVDNVHAGGGNDTIFAGDTLSLDDTVDGGDGYDTLHYDYSADTDLFNVSHVENISIGGSGDASFTVTGGMVEDLSTGVFTMDASSLAGTFLLDASDVSTNLHITGSSESGNTITGGTGSDTIEGGNTDDVLNGGSDGSNTVSYAHASGTVTINLEQQGVGQSTGGSGHDELVNFQNIIGSGYADTLTGDKFDNIIEGGAVHSTDTTREVLTGGADDTNYGGGHSEILGDTVSYEHLSGTYNGTGVTIDFGEGTAIYNTYDNGSDGDTTIHTDDISGFENIIGSAYADSLTGDRYAGNTIHGLAGNDTIHAGQFEETAAPNEYYGDAGTDTIVYDAAVNVVLNLDSTAHTLTDLYSAYVGMTTSIDASTAQSSNDGIHTDHLFGFENVIGTYGDDFLIGDSGNNVFQGMLGDDTIIGGAGTDTVSYVSASGPVTIDLFGESTTGADGHDHLAGIENAIGSNTADTITGNSGDNVIEGLKGADILNGYSGSGAHGDTVSYEHSISGVTVNLDSVNDITTHHISDTTCEAGKATDGYAGDTSTDIISNFANIMGSHYADVLIGDSGDNVLEGQGNTLATDSGGDVLFGNGGADTLSYEHFVGTPNSDSTEATGVTVDLANAQGTENVTIGLDTFGYDVFHATYNGYGGNETQDTILGMFTNVIGSQQADTIIGNGQANILQGLGGNDTLTGNGGADIFHFSSLSGTDTITDFAHGTDKIQINTSIFSGLGTSLTENTNFFTVSDGSSHSGSSGAASLSFDTSDHTLYYDADGTGTGAAVAVAHVTAATVTASDITLVTVDPGH